MPSNDEFTLDYYAHQAKLHGDAISSTMLDGIVRQREQDFIHASLAEMRGGGEKTKVLDLGCGNGCVTRATAAKFPTMKITGGDFCDELLSIAKKHESENCRFEKVDARNMPFEDQSFDCVVTERCLINIRDWEEQKQAVAEVARVLKQGGHYVMLECFTDGHENYNRARMEMGLDEIPLPKVNRFFDKDDMMKELSRWFEKHNNPIKYPPNFLSSHYFCARVLHAAIDPNSKVRNSEFVKFFAQAVRPDIGNYSPIQGYRLVRK